MKNKKKVNEDNWTGFHHGTITNGMNEAPVPADAPVGTSILHGTGAPGGYVDPATGNVTNNFNFFSNNRYSRVSNRLHGVEAGSGAASGAAASGAANPNGAAWFAANMKTIAIVAVGSAALFGLIKLIKRANREIKVRYNKMVKTLQRAQQDFVSNEDGLDSKAVMHGQGSKIADVFARIFTLNVFKKDKERRNNTRTLNIGILPFCEKYKEEIANDFKCSVDAFNKIKLASDEKNNGESPEYNNAENELEGVNTKVYGSFHEAFSSDPLFEGKEVNESALAAISAGIGIASLAVRGGRFLISKLNNKGIPEEGSEKEVQVTKESTREICYAIVYNYLEKYVNMKNVFKELGISSESLADLDASSCDKLTSILEKYQKPEKNQYGKQYFRIKEAFDTMLSHYYAIGDGLIKNFEKYTKAEDEKHANLLVAAKEKLQAMWDSQKDVFNSNFSHIIIEITSSDAYIQYLNFIIEKVMPVFKSGIAGDADYVLDIVPQKNQYYLVRQTGDQPFGPENGENKGNVAIAKVESFDREKQEIKFKLIGLFNGEYSMDDHGIVNLHDDYYDDESNYKESKIDYNAFKDDDGKKKELTMKYGKWLSLDPRIMDWKETVESNIFRRDVPAEKPENEEYVFAYGSKESNSESGREEYNRIVFASYDMKSLEYRKAVLIKLKNPITKDEFAALCERKSDESAKNMNFENYGNPHEASSAYKKVRRINSLKKEEIDASNTDDIIRIINEVSVSLKIKAATSLYKRTTKDKRGRDIDEYIFAEVSGDLESVYVESGAQRLNDRVNEAEDSSTKVMKPGDKGSDKNLVARMFCVNVSAGKPIAGDRKENKFSGSIVKIDPACSVDDLYKEMQKMNPKFEVVEKDADTIRKSMVDGILDNKGSREVTLGNAYPIEKISDAISVIEDRENSAERMDNEIGSIAEKIVNGMKALNLNPETDFGKRKLKSKENVFVGSKEYMFKGVTKDVQGMSKNGYFAIDTEIKDNNGKNIEIDVFPVMMSAKQNGNDSSTAKPQESLGAILMIGNYKQTVVFNEDEIKKGVSILFKEFKEGHNFEDSRFSMAVSGESPNDSSTNTQDSSTNGKDSSTNNQDSSTGKKNDNPFSGVDPEKLSSMSSSVQVKYDSAKSIKEGLYTTVTVGRSYSEYMPKWYVLSESVYDDGCGSKTSLDSPSVRRRMNTRSDVMNYVKANENARIMQFESNHTYSIENGIGYVPSVETPLYESVVFFKFDSDGNVVEKIYAGNNRIR